MALQENSHQLSRTSNLGHNFDIDLNKTFDLNKCDEHLKVSDGIKTISEPLNKLTFDCIHQKRSVSTKLSEMESDESLGIIPDLLNDEMTFDLFKTEVGCSDNEIHDVFSPEINENPASLVFSPPSDNQFNKISLFLKNVSTPLPNFGNDRRCSSTPKILAASQFATNIIEDNSLPHFLDEKEEPIIAGSCRIKFETDFNLDDLKNVKPLTSTCKALCLPQVSFVLSDLNEESNLKSELNFQERPETIKNNLNVTQTFSNNEDLFPCERGDSIQNVNILNNTFQIGPSVFMESADVVVSSKRSIPSTMKISQVRPIDYSEKEKVGTLDSTFAIPGTEINCNVNCEKTFVIDLNLTADTEVSSKSIYKDRMLNETHVLEMGSIEFSSKQQEQIANVTFTKDLENDTQISLENRYYDSHVTTFKPMKQILEETFSENYLNEMKVHTNNVLQCINGKSQAAFSETFNANVTFSGKLDEILPEKIIQNDNYPIEFETSNSPKALPIIFHEDTEEKNCFHDQINLTENENDPANKMSLSNALQSIGGATFSEKIYERANQDIKKPRESDSIENDNSLLQSPKASATYSEEAGEKNYFHDRINHSENVSIPANKTSHSDSLQSISNASFSEEANEKSDQEVDKFFRRDPIQDENSSELASFILPKVSKSFTIYDRSEETNILELSPFQNSNALIEKSTPSLQPIFSKRTAYSLDLNQFDNCNIGTNFSEVVQDSVFIANASEETELYTRSISMEDCSLKILSKPSNIYENTTFSEKNCQVLSGTNSILTENGQLQTSQNSLEEMSNGTFSEKTGEVQPSLNPPREVNAPISKSFDKGIEIQHEIHLNQYKRDSVGETTSSNLSNLFLKDTKKTAVKHNSSIKSCSLESKTVIKSGLIKPTRIVYPRVVSEKRVGQLPIAKSLCKPIAKMPVTSDFNRTVNLSDNSTDKSFPKDLDRRFSLSCTPTSGDNKSKYKNAFKKPLEVSWKLGIQKPVSNFQKSRLDAKNSNGQLKNITTINDKQQVSSRTDLISNKDPKIVKSIASVYGKERSVSSRLSLHERLPMKSFKIKESGLKANTAVVTAENGTNKISCCPKFIDLPRNEKLTEIGINRANLGKNSRHSIATNLPRNLKTSLSCIPNKTCNSKPIASKQRSVPAINSFKFDSIKAQDSEKTPKSIAKLKFSLLHKGQSRIKISSDGSESKNAVDKKPASGNQKSKGFLTKPEGEAVQFVKTYTNTEHKKQKDNTRKNSHPDSSMGSTSSKPAVQPLNPLNVKKSNGQYNFLPMPKIIKDVKGINLNGASTAQESEQLQNQVYRRTSGRLPQLRRIPAPRYNK